MTPFVHASTSLATGFSDIPARYQERMPVSFLFDRDHSKDDRRLTHAASQKLA
jgi:hypothetical protein